MSNALAITIVSVGRVPPSLSLATPQDKVRTPVPTMFFKRFRVALTWGLEREEEEEEEEEEEDWEEERGVVSTGFL